MFARSLLVVAMVCSCRGEPKRQYAETMPAATEWQNGPAQGDPAGHPPGGDPHGGMAGDPHGGMAADPHGGMAADPHAGLAGAPQAGTAGDPHARLDMGGDPHAGMGAGGSLPNLPAPDPNRPIDKSKFIAGTIVGTKDTRSRVKRGDILFLSVRPINPATGEIIGSPLAVDRIDIAELPVAFRLDGQKAMSAGTRFEGDVVVVARVDRDGDAITKRPGDIEGHLKTKIPADKVTLKLDRLIQ